MRIVLLQTAPWRPDMPPLGLPYVQAALRAAGHVVTLADINFAMFELASTEERVWWETSHAYIWNYPAGPQLAALLARAQPAVDQLLRGLLANDVGIVGLTMLSTQKAFALWLAGRVKAINSRCGVLAGGPQCFPQYEPAAIAASPHVDWVVVGEGEYSSVDLVRWVGEGQRGPVPAGVITHAGEKGPDRTLEKDIDEIPFPDFTGLPLNTTPVGQRLTLRRHSARASPESTRRPARGFGRGFRGVLRRWPQAHHDFGHAFARRRWPSDRG